MMASLAAMMTRDIIIVLLCTGIGFPGGVAKRLSGRLSLAPRQARVLTKFCFDFNPTCKDHTCTNAEFAGLIDVNVYGAKRTDEVVEGSEKGEVFVALLDDEYYSFPEVAQVWNDANCSDVLRASKQKFPLEWDKVTTKDGENITSPLDERLRPRWWYIAFVSCSPHGVELSYRMHVQNQLRGYRREFSMDEMDLSFELPLLCIAFAGLALAQLTSMRDWREKSRTGSLLHLHPALLMITASVFLSFIGQASWLTYYWNYQKSGEGTEHWVVCGRGGLIAAKTIMQLLLMLLAQGECVCTPVISWSANQELVGGQVLFGGLSLALEMWGDSESRSSTTEFVYDTKPGIVLLAMDCLWLWMFASRSFQTYRRETRVKQRSFYKQYGPLFALWFASLPAVSALAQFLSAWVRFRVTFALTSLTQALCLGLLIYTFRPAVAVRLYELTTTEYKAVKGDENEVDNMCDGDDDI